MWGSFWNRDKERCVAGQTMMRTLTITLLTFLGTTACQDATTRETPYPTSDEARLSRACRPLRPEERCVAGPARLAEPERSTESIFSKDGNSVYHFGRRERFDAGSFRYAKTEGCPLWLGVYAWDSNDVYFPRPQSCGGANCARPDYTGFYWDGIGVESPSAFRWIGMGYARDGAHVYYQWKRGPLTAADRGGFDVCLYHDDVALGHDGVTWFHEGSPISASDALSM